MTGWKWLAATLAAILAAVCLFSLPYCGRNVPAGELPPLVTRPGKVRAPAEDPVDLNGADLALLMTLPDIGETRANAILHYRQIHGPFQSVDELAAVEGIGPGILELVREYVCVKQASD